MRKLSVAGILVVLGSLASPQEPKSIVVKDLDRNFTIADSSLPTPQNPPADLELVPQGPGARKGTVWVRNGAFNLVITGIVDGDDPEFPHNKNHILEADHVEVWLAFVDDVPLPPVGFGNQFGPETVASEQDCLKRSNNRPADEKYVAKCNKWYQQQLRYRVRFKKLFMRQWLITDSYREESFAAPAYEEIVRDFASDQSRYEEEIPRLLKPAQSQHFTAYLQHYGGQPGYRFTVNIPWDVMPPVNSLEISRLRMLVEVYSPAPQGKKTGPYSTTAPGRKYGRPETFTLLTLKTPRRFQISACGGQLELKNKYDEPLPGWFIPFGGQQNWITSIFGITNEALGYMYEPDGLSPIAHEKKFFYKQAGASEWVCGPEFKYRVGTEIHDYNIEIDQQGMDVKRLPDGTLLVKEGPLEAYRTFGSGQCGGCATARLAIYAIGKDRKLAKLLAINDFVDESSLAAEKIDVSPDWNTVTVYQSSLDEKGDENWSSNIYCRHQLKYDRCGGKDHVEPPSLTLPN